MNMKEKAYIYWQYLNGWVYISLQVLPIYEEAYEEIHGKI